MKSVLALRYLLAMALVLGMVCLAVVPTAIGASSTFDVTKMSDMSDFDPNTVKQPTGDTIKMGYLQIMSGPAAGNGELYWPMINWVAYDLNKRGGILVDGKRKKIEIITGDIQGKPATTKQEAERLCQEEKVDLLWGTSRLPSVQNYRRRGRQVQSPVYEYDVLVQYAHGRQELQSLHLPDGQQRDPMELGNGLLLGQTATDQVLHPQSGLRLRP